VVAYFTGLAQRVNALVTAALRVFTSSTEGSSQLAATPLQQRNFVGTNLELAPSAVKTFHPTVICAIRKQRET